MPSSIGHAAMAILLRPTLPAQERNAATVGFAAVAAIALDIDAIGRLFGGGDVGFMGGHRAITHSVAAAVIIAATGAVVLVGRRRASSINAVFPYLASVIMSHGVLDMLTSYGEGVQLLAPFSTRPFAFPWKLFIGSMLPEILILWVPALLFLMFRVGIGKKSIALASDGGADMRPPRLRALSRPVVFAIASVAMGLTVGLTGLTSPRQVGAYLSILGERTSSTGRFDADSTRRVIAAAEAAGSSKVAPGDRAPGIPASARRCVAVQDTDAVATSGGVTAGVWSGYRTSWIRGGGTLWWRTTQPSVGPSDTLSVRAIRLDRALPPGAERTSSGRAHLRRVSRSGDTLVFTLNERRRQSAFRSDVRVPTPGRWLFIATMGGDWGCFIFRV
jgi:membrane-bound metal-dependent hydrolase YbcI (DUF457 family)